MALWLCEGTYDEDPCGTLYAVGLYRCPRCHSTAFHEFGSRPEDEEHPMAKITVLRGVSDATATPDDVAAPVSADETSGEATGDGAEFGPSRPRADARKDVWVAYAVELGYDEAYATSLTKLDLGELPDDPADDTEYVAWLEAQTAPDDEEEGDGAEDGAADGADES